ncbi:MAG: hypothetical protein M3P51_09115 [Chloroflexota bacterium]|nr:hypothetical protein [Chloroflexota bacterium]
MQGLIFSPRGQLVHEFDDVQPGPVQWAETVGAATVLMPRVRDLFFERLSSLPRHLVMFRFPDDEAHGGGAGLPGWAGVVLEPGRQGRALMLPIEGSPWLLKRLVLRSGDRDPRIRLVGTAKQRLAAAVRACPSDGFPVKVSHDSEHGDLDTVERVMPQSLYSYVDTLAKQNGMRWTTRPVFDGNSLVIEIVLRDRLGTDYERSDDFELGTEVIDAPEATINSYGVINEVVALGKSQQGKTTPCVVVSSPRARAAHGDVTLSVVKEFPGIATTQRLQAAAEAFLRPRTIPFRTEAKKITSARAGADTYRKVRLGNTFNDRRIEAFSFDPRANEVTLALRVLGNGAEPEGSE